MKSRAEQLDEMSKDILIATDRIRYYKVSVKRIEKQGSLAAETTYQTLTPNCASH